MPVRTRHSRRPNSRPRGSALGLIAAIALVGAVARSGVGAAAVARQPLAHHLHVLVQPEHPGLLAGAAGEGGGLFRGATVGDEIPDHANGGDQQGKR